MEKFTLHMLEYESMKQDLMSYAVTYAGRDRIARLAPMSDRRRIEREMQETAEALLLVERGSSVPLPSLEGIEVVASLLGTGYLFSEQDLTAVQVFLQSCGHLRKYIESKGDAAWQIGIHAASLRDLPALRQEINRCIRHGEVTNEASRELERVRRRMEMTKEKINKKIQGFMSRYASILQENIISQRGGRYVVPIKREFYKQVKGRMLDQSTSGQTVFIEPDEIAVLQGELEVLLGEEAREEAKVLGMLAELVEQEADTIKHNIEITSLCDFIFAKARYAASMDAVPVNLNDCGETVLRGARHPKLLDVMVPLDLSIGKHYKTLIITGPNTGGKTVVLKTLGLLALMVQSGLLVPVLPGSRFSVYREIMAVIGDGQNLEQSLSTFSAQIHSLAAMLQEAGPGSLLLIDELAAGTDPGEGIALSVAILEEFRRKGSTVLVTTHFNELKTFASRASGFENARMEFDAETLRPLYRLTIGLAGQSYAIDIACKLGIPEGIITRSRQLVVKETNVDTEADMGIGGAGIGMGAGADIGIGADMGAGADMGIGAQIDTEANMDTSLERKNHLQHGKIPGQGYEEKHEYEQEQEHEEKHEHEHEQSQAGQEVQPSVHETARPVFEVGDAVQISALGKIGIVTEAEDHRGMVGIMVQRQRMKMNWKRLKPYLKKEALYPEDYDLDIIFDTKENRKKRHLMGKRHIEGMEIIRKPGE